MPENCITKGQTRLGKHPFTKRKDIPAIGILLLLSLAAAAFLRFRPAADGSLAQVLLDGKVVYTASLSEDQIFSIPQRPQVRLEVRDGRGAFISSDCPDQVCVHAGFLDRAGQTAVCLPNRMVLRICNPEETSDGLDAVVR